DAAQRLLEIVRRDVGEIVELAVRALQVLRALLERAPRAHQRLLLRLLLGDVPEHAGQTRRSAVSIAHGLRARSDRPQVAVGAIDAVLVLVIRTAFADEARVGLHDAGPIVRV